MNSQAMVQSPQEKCAGRRVVVVIPAQVRDIDSSTATRKGLVCVDRNADDSHRLEFVVLRAVCRPLLSVYVPLYLLTNDIIPEPPR